MRIYLSSLVLLSVISCKQANGNLDTSKDSIQLSKDTVAKVNENIDYEAIWSEANLKSESDFSANFDSISNIFKEYIPSGHVVDSFSTGDANLDGLTDTILIVKNKEDAHDLGSLLLFLKQNNGLQKFSLINYDILNGDSNIVKIDNGRIFIFEQYNAAVEILFFEFNKSKNNWLFIEQFSSGLDGNGNVTKATELVTLDKYE